MRVIVVSVAAVLPVVAGCARTPQATPTAIPVPLVSALIDDRSSASRPAPSYAVGKLPAGYPVALVPTGPVAIVGGMTTVSEIIAVFSDSTRRLPAVIEELFEQKGYKRPPPTPASGFTSASGPYSFFCGDSGTVSVAPLTGPNRSFARVTYRRESNNYFCRPRDPVAAEKELALPELKPPEGVSVGGTGGGNGGDGVHSSAEVYGVDLNAGKILAHYAGQLAAAGWTTEPPAIGQHVAAQYFQAKDSSGAKWEGILMATGDKSALALSLNMHPRKSQ